MFLRSSMNAALRSVLVAGVAEASVHGKEPSVVRVSVFALTFHQQLLRMNGTLVGLFTTAASRLGSRPPLKSRHPVTGNPHVRTHRNPRPRPPDFRAGCPRLRRSGRVDGPAWRFGVV